MQLVVTVVMAGGSWLWYTLGYDDSDGCSKWQRWWWMVMIAVSLERVKMDTVHGEVNKDGCDSDDGDGCSYGGSSTDVD